MADPLLRLDFSVKSLNQVVGVAAMCLQEEPTVRPYITDVVTALSFLDFDANEPSPSSLPSLGNKSIEDVDDGDQSYNESEGSFSNQEDDEDVDDGDHSDNESESCFTNQEDKKDANDGDQSDNERESSSLNQEDDVRNDEDDDEEEEEEDDDENNKSNSSSNHEENINDDNDDDKCSRNSLDHENENGNKVLCAGVSPDHKDSEKITKTHADDRVGFTSDKDNIDDIHDDMSCYSLDDEDTALTIELDNRNSLSDISIGEAYDDDEVEQNIRIKSSNSKKGKVMEVSDDESIYSSSTSRSSNSSIDYKLGEKQTTQKAKSTKKSNVGNVSKKKSKNRWRGAELALNYETKK